VSFPLSGWTDELARTNATALGMPPGSTWIMVYPERAIDHKEPTFPLRLRQEGGSEWRCTVPYDEVRPAQGFFFQLFGRMVDEPTTPRYWRFAPHSKMPQGLNVELWWMGVAIGTSMRALLQYNPAEWTYQRTIQLISDEWERDVSLVLRAGRVLSMEFSKSGAQELAELVTAARQLEPGEPITRENLGRVLSVGVDAIQKRFQRAGVRNLGGFKRVYENEYKNYKS
jgi:hypothetical protein